MCIDHSEVASPPHARILTLSNNATNLRPRTRHSPIASAQPIAASKYYKASSRDSHSTSRHLTTTVHNLANPTLELHSARAYTTALPWFHRHIHIHTENMASNPQDPHTFLASQVPLPHDADDDDDDGAETLSPLEQEVLDEYARLLENLNDVRWYPSPNFARERACDVTLG
jgi:hypothetical protein